MPEGKDPVMEVIEEIIEKFGDGCKDWFRSEVAEIIKYRRQVKRESREPDTATLLEKLAEKVVKYEQGIESVRAKLNLLAEQPPSNPEMKILSRWGKEFLNEIETSLK